MNLENFYEKEFKDYSESPDKYCNICYCEHDSTSLKLNCGHEYHYECILHSYKLNNIKKKRWCPYCRKYGGYLPLLDNEPQKDIHVEYYNSSTLEVTKHTHCCAVIKSGPNKNLKCNKLTLKNYNYCGIHKKK